MIGKNQQTKISRVVVQVLYLWHVYSPVCVSSPETKTGFLEMFSYGSVRQQPLIAGWQPERLVAYHYRQMAEENEHYGVKLQGNFSQEGQSYSIILQWELNSSKYDVSRLLTTLLTFNNSFLKVWSSCLLQKAFTFSKPKRATMALIIQNSKHVIYQVLDQLNCLFKKYIRFVHLTFL